MVSARRSTWAAARLAAISLALIASACSNTVTPPDDDPVGDGPVAAGVSGRLGTAVSHATAEQLASFERGRAVMMKRFTREAGVGPVFNVTFCGACHEDPVFGGSAALYRNFLLGGTETTDGAFIPTLSDDIDAGGVVRMLKYGETGDFRPSVSSNANIFAQRNAIPMFGTGLIAELSEEVILANMDVADKDGDGISGRPNFDRGFVGRFGRKAQTVSIEGFIRGPLFNHLGITTNPLSDAQRAALPVDSSDRDVAAFVGPERLPVRTPHQAAAADAPNFDTDDAPDPEMTGQELFDLVTFVMLLAAPELDELTAESERGRVLFHEANCSGCHIPRLEGPRGPLPLYSDLLLHDMGEGLDDGIVMKEATSSEFRTQPLWGLSATGPYLHDGRASSIIDAILAHGGEAQASRDAFAALSAGEQADVEAFLMSLGGRDQASPGLLPPNTPMPGVGEYGGPFRELDDEEQAQFLRGRGVYDRDFGFSEGAGALAGSDGAGRFNGDSCRACHFDPVIGGSGPAGVNVMRHGRIDEEGTFMSPEETPNSILHRHSQIGMPVIQAEPGTNVFEHRQTPHTFGLGLINGIDRAVIEANADPDDANEDGISGRAHILSDGRLGRLGWKADVPDFREFVRDAMAAEIGLTLPVQTGLTFGLVEDDDDVPDPELSLAEAEDLGFFIEMLAGPPRQAAADPALAARGEIVFGTVGCVRCHIPALPSPNGDVPLYSDLLLHEILPADAVGVSSGAAGQREFRTAPLWGLSQTAPYFHTGAADTIGQAIEMHDGEAADIRNAYLELSDDDRTALLAFLNTL